MLRILSISSHQNAKKMTDTITLTDLEKQVLSAIFINEYNDGCKYDHPTWLSVVADYSVKGKTLSGVVSSLTQKGLIGTQDEGGDATIWGTREAFFLMLEEDSFKAELKKWTGKDFES